MYVYSMCLVGPVGPKSYNIKMRFLSSVLHHRMRTNVFKSFTTRYTATLTSLMYIYVYIRLTIWSECNSEPDVYEMRMCLLPSFCCRCTRLHRAWRRREPSCWSSSPTHVNSWLTHALTGRQTKPSCWSSWLTHVNSWLIHALAGRRIKFKSLSSQISSHNR